MRKKENLPEEKKKETEGGEGELGTGSGPIVPNLEEIAESGTKEK